MATLTDMLAAVVLQSSAAVFTHFGVTPEPPKVQAPPPAAPSDQRVVARTPPPPQPQRTVHPDKAAVACADVRSAPVLRT